MSLGVKRTFADMHGVGNVNGSPNPSSRNASPSRRSSIARDGSRSQAQSRASSPNLDAVAEDESRPDVPPARRTYEEGASIVLIGIRGSGKSSLAVLAASAYNRRLLDFERVFLERTGHTIASHRQTVGVPEHRKRHRQILDDVLHKNSQGCVIVCNFSDLEQGAHLLRWFARTHPVVHVVRDIEGIRAHVKVWSSAQISKMLAVSGQLLRHCSSFEYYNRTEDDGQMHHDTAIASADQTSEDRELQSGQRSPSAPFLRLKRTERDFLKFLRLVLGDHQRIPSHESAYPLSHIPVESRKFTYAATVDSFTVTDGILDLEAIQTGVDAIQIIYEVVPPEETTEAALIISSIYAEVRRATILPLILQVKHGHVTKSHPRKAELYLQHLQFCLRLAPEYLVVDLDVEAPQLRRIIDLRGNTKVIGKAELDFPKVTFESADCVSMWEKGVGLKCDVVQLSHEARGEYDHLALDAFRNKIYRGPTAGTRLSAFLTGTYGRPTQCFNEILTPVPFVSPTLALDGSKWVTAQQATNALFASFRLEALRFCVIGASVDYSLSPPLHNTAFAACGMPHVYTAKSIGSLDILQQFASDNVFGGCAVAQPFKVQIVGRLATLSRHAQIIQAVNSVLPMRRAPTGKTPTDLEVAASRNVAGEILTLHGDNTDWIGIRACIRKGLSPINTVRASSTGLVIGAGGMARAAIYAMLHMGVQNIFICNRTVSNAEELAKYYNSVDISTPKKTQHPSRPSTPHAPKHQIHVIKSFDDSWPEGFRLPTMVVSSIPAQERGGSLIANFTLPPAWLKSPTGGVVVELTYKPLVTALVQQIRSESKRGWIAMNGLDYLPEQAFAQFELFTGRRAPRRIMREEVVRLFAALRPNHHDSGPC